MAVARSKPYPALPLGEAVEKLQIVSKKLGSSPSYNKETFAQGMGYNGSNNGAFQRSVAALIQYDLVQKSGSTYVLASNSQKILFPTSSEERVQAIRDAGLTPNVFSQLYGAYKGQELPDLLPNILVTNYGILPAAKDKVVSIFRASMEYAGLLDGNKLRVANEPDAEQALPKPEEDGVSSTHAPAPSPKSTVASTTLVKDFGEGRVASLSIPSDISNEEREKLKTLIENM